MKSQFSFRAGLVALALAFGLLGGGPTVRGQIECIGDCLEELSGCAAACGGGCTQCEDEYVACAEDCLAPLP